MTITDEERREKLDRTLRDAEALIKGDGYKAFIIAIHADINDHECTCVGAIGSEHVADVVHMVASGAEAVQQHVVEHYGELGLGFCMAGIAAASGARFEFRKKGEEDDD